MLVNICISAKFIIHVYVLAKNSSLLSFYLKNRIDVNIVREFVHHMFLLLTVSFALSVPIKMQSKPKYFSGSCTTGGGDGNNTIGIALLVQPILRLF